MREQNGLRVCKIRCLRPMSKDEALESLATGDGEPSKNETYEFPDKGAMPESDSVLIHSVSPTNLHLTIGGVAGRVTIAGVNLDNLQPRPMTDAEFTVDIITGTSTSIVADIIVATGPAGDFDLAFFDQLLGKFHFYERKRYFIVRY
jgi:hypothetical protein